MTYYVYVASGLSKFVIFGGRQLFCTPKNPLPPPKLTKTQFSQGV